MLDNDDNDDDIGTGVGGKFNLRVGCTPHSRRIFRFLTCVLAAFAEGSLFCSLLAVDVSGCIVAFLVVVLLPLSDGA